MRLSEKCPLCGSLVWCGRQCANAPSKAAPPVETPAVSPDPPPFKPYKDGEGYSPKTQLYEHFCVWCGVAFKGTQDKTYCSDACRVNAWRARKREGAVEAHIGSRPHYGWAQRRFAVLERDGFKCRYCGRGAAQQAVLHVDHILPKSAGGGDELENLITACQECNYGKGDAQIENKPD